MGIETILVIILWGALIAYIVWRFMPARGLKKMKQEEFRASLRKGQLIDVREPNEYKGGHIIGARNIPVGQMKLRMKELRKDQPILMYCQGKSRTNQYGQAAIEERIHGRLYARRRIQELERQNQKRLSQNGRFSSQRIGRFFRTRSTLLTGAGLVSLVN